MSEVKLYVRGQDRTNVWLFAYLLPRLAAPPGSVIACQPAPLLAQQEETGSQSQPSCSPVSGLWAADLLSPSPPLHNRNTTQSVQASELYGEHPTQYAYTTGPQLTAAVISHYSNSVQSIILGVLLTRALI